MKNNSHILGMYNYSGSPVVNMTGRLGNSVDETVIHEYTHGMITHRTTYGLMCHMLSGLSKIDSKHFELLNILIANNNKLQEAFATFVEYSLIYLRDGELKFWREVKELKESNVEYYRYLNNLLFLFRKDEDILKIVEFGTRLCFFAMSPDLLRIPVKSINTNKNRKDFFRDHKNIRQYLAVTRFNKILHLARKEIKSGAPLNSETLLRINKDSGLNEAYFDEDYLESLKYYLKDLYKNSKDRKKAQINKMIDSMEMKSIEEYDASVVVPSSFQIYDQVVVNFDKLLNKSYSMNGTLFVLMDLADTEGFKSRGIHLIEAQYKRELEKCNGATFGVMYMDLIDKKTYVAMLTEAELSNIMAQSKSPIVVTMDFYTKNILNKLPAKELIWKNIFIYSDNSYKKLESNLKEIINRSAKARIVEYPHMYLLIVKQSNTFTYIQPIISTFINDLIKVFKEGKYNVTLADNPDGETMTDPYILKELSDIEEYDFIINCLYNT
ncbi:MAG TPA: hypothetical protein VEF53_21145 [Patescibacteria group bacterium]|nr:hypothetical protein [Patescibacteria group bacterium]